MLICPKCGKPLTTENKAMACPARHSYDIAAAGYVNLLQSGKSGDAIGDSKEMIAARRGFLDTGYYAPLAVAVCAETATLLAENPSGHIVDAGCGEGFYTRAVAEHLPGAQVVGIDISRHGCLAAAKRDKRSLYVTASCAEMPVAGGWADVVLSLFAPTFGPEFRRVLAHGGRVLQVVPGKNHLLQLKEAVYSQVYQNREDKHSLEGFQLLSRQRVEYTCTLDDPTHIRQLFAMTPYFFRTPKEGMARLNALTSMEVTLDFMILLFA